MGVYLYYLKSLGWNLSFIGTMLHIASQAFSVYSSIWLTDWSNASSKNETMSDSERNKYLGVYGALGFAQGTLY
jgi:hypothetical protein